MFDPNFLVPTIGAFVAVGIVSFLVYRDSTQIDRMIAEAKEKENTSRT